MIWVGLTFFENVQTKILSSAFLEVNKELSQTIASFDDWDYSLTKSKTVRYQRRK